MATEHGDSGQELDELNLDVNLDDFSLDDDKLFADLDNEVRLDADLDAGAGGDELDLGGDLDLDAGTGGDELDLGGDLDLDAGAGGDELDLGGDLDLDAGAGGDELDLGGDLDLDAGAGGDDLDLGGDLDLGEAGTGGDELDLGDLDVDMEAEGAGEEAPAGEELELEDEELDLAGEEAETAYLGNLDVDLEAEGASEEVPGGQELELGDEELDLGEGEGDLDLGEAGEGDLELSFEEAEPEAAFAEAAGEGEEALELGDEELELGDEELDLGEDEGELDLGEAGEGDLDLGLEETEPEAAFAEAAGEGEEALELGDEDLELGDEELDLGEDEGELDLELMAAEDEQAFKEPPGEPAEEEAFSFDVGEVGQGAQEEPMGFAAAGEDEGFGHEEMLSVEHGDLDLGAAESEFEAVPDVNLEEVNLAEVGLSVPELGHDEMEAQAHAEEEEPELPDLGMPDPFRAERGAFEEATVGEPDWGSAAGGDFVAAPDVNLGAEEVVELNLDDLDRGAVAAQAPRQTAARGAGAEGYPPATVGAIPSDVLLSIPRKVSVEMGSVTLNGQDLLKLAYGSVVQLTQTVGDPVELVLEGHTIAQGEIVLINGRNLGVRILSLRK